MRMEEIRLIDANALINHIKNTYCEPCKKEKSDHNGVMCRACGIDDAIEQIDDAPTVDAVVHATRVIERHFGRMLYVCGACGGWYNDTKFCPHCGAKMDGGQCLNL